MIPSRKTGVFIGVLLGGIIMFIILLTDNSAKTIEIVAPDPNPIAYDTLVEEPEPVKLSFGGTEVLPAYRYVALYGNPTYPSLGSLGEQGMLESVARIKELSAQYQLLSTEKVIPTFEIITTVASAGPTENDDYSQELDKETIQPLINTAKEQGVYVVLDLQPGRTSFAEQVKHYESLLLEPHVGLALDPEWRLRTPEARHLRKVGTVTAEEINQTSDWLADLVKLHELPQKLFIVHQFKLSMIENRELLKTDRVELGYIIHMDGHGTLGQKIETWNNVKTNLPTNTYLGWKNFIDEDSPTPTPEQTMAQVPKPWFVSYQ